MLIIEGPDHVGKTTAALSIVKLCAERARLGVQLLDTNKLLEGPLDLPLCERPHPVRYVHMTRPNHAFNHYTHYLDMLSPYAVQDRFHLGDPAYNGDGALSEAELIRLEGWIMDFASVVVVMYTTDADWLLKRLGQKEEMFNNNKVLKANDVYAQIATGTYSYDYHVDVVWDVRDGRWPDDRTLNEWIDTWYRRIECWLTS